MFQHKFNKKDRIRLEPAAAPEEGVCKRPHWFERAGHGGDGPHQDHTIDSPLKEGVENLAEKTAEETIAPILEKNAVATSLHSIEFSLRKMVDRLEDLSKSEDCQKDLLKTLQENKKNRQDILEMTRRFEKSRGELDALKKQFQSFSEKFPAGTKEQSSLLALNPEYMTQKLVEVCRKGDEVGFKRIYRLAEGFDMRDVLHRADPLYNTPFSAALYSGNVALINLVVERLRETCSDCLIDYHLAGEINFLNYGASIGLTCPEALKIELGVNWGDVFVHRGPIFEKIFRWSQIFSSHPTLFHRYRWHDVVPLDKFRHFWTQDKTFKFEGDVSALLRVIRLSQNATFMLEQIDAIKIKFPQLVQQYGATVQEMQKHYQGVIEDGRAILQIITEFDQECQADYEALLSKISQPFDDKSASSSFDSSSGYSVRQTSSAPRLMPWRFDGLFGSTQGASTPDGDLRDTARLALYAAEHSKDFMMCDKGRSDGCEFSFSNEGGAVIRIQLGEIEASLLSTALPSGMWQEMSVAAGDGARHGLWHGIGRVVNYSFIQQGYSEAFGEAMRQGTYYSLYAASRLAQRWQSFDEDVSLEDLFTTAQHVLVETTVLATCHLGLQYGKAALTYCGETLFQKGYPRIAQVARKGASLLPYATFLYQAHAERWSTSFAALLAGKAVSDAVEKGGCALVDGLGKKKAISAKAKFL